jgi:hypothetical protein
VAAASTASARYADVITLPHTESVSGHKWTRCYSRADLSSLVVPCVPGGRRS